MNILQKTILTIAIIASTIAPAVFAAAPKKVTQSYQANQAAVTPHGAAQLKAAKMCNTDFKDKSKTAKDEYRKLVFEAGIALGHPCPELIMLINNKEDRAASGGCYIQGKVGRAVFIDQDELDKDTYGSRRITIFHEVAHLTKRDSTLQAEHGKQVAKQASNNIIKGTISFDQACKQGKEKIAGFAYQCEVIADKYAAQGAACQVCARQKGDFFFRHVEQKYAQGLSRSKVKEMNFEELTQLIERLEPQSKIYCAKENDCHPLCIERAVRFYRYALSEEISGRLCAYHKEKAIAKADRKKAQQAKDDAQEAHAKKYRAQMLADREAAKQAAAKKQAAGMQQTAATATAAAPTATICSEPEFFTEKELFNKTYNGKSVDLLLGKTVQTYDTWKFGATNAFERGEVVSALRSSGEYTYGIVLNTDKNTITIQVEMNVTKKIPSQIVGKATVPTKNKNLNK